MSWYKISSKKHEKSGLSAFSRFEPPPSIHLLYLTQPQLAKDQVQGVLKGKHRQAQSLKVHVIRRDVRM